MNLNELYTFSLVARHGTLSGAAAALDVPKSTVSRRVQRLEDALGTELLRRSPRAVSITADGQALYESTAPAIREILESTEAVKSRNSELSGMLRITTVPDFGQTRYFVEVIRSFGEKYPKVTIEVDFNYRLVNLAEENFDVGFRLHPTPIPHDGSMVTRRVMGIGGGLYASQSYLEEIGHPTCTQDLAQHSFAVSPAFPRGSIADALREPALEDLKAKWNVKDFSVLSRIAESGAGIAILLSIIGDPLVREGHLVRVLPDLDLPGGSMSMVWPVARHLTPRVKIFVEHAVDLLEQDDS